MEILEIFDKQQKKELTLYFKVDKQALEKNIRWEDSENQESVSVKSNKNKIHYI